MGTSWAARIIPETHGIGAAMLWAPPDRAVGLRQNEVCQLRTCDVKDEHGILFFDVTEKLKVKTEASIRPVPVHSELIRCGFRQHVEALIEKISSPKLGLSHVHPPGAMEAARMTPDPSLQKSETPIEVRPIAPVGRGRIIRQPRCPGERRGPCSPRGEGLGARRASHGRHR